MMTTSLPLTLTTAIQQLLADHNIQASDLQKAAQDLSVAYRTHQFTRALADKKHVLSYLAVRLPATYAVIKQILTHIKEHPVKSLLDIGSGPGTVLWAAQEIFPNLHQAILIEQHPYMLEISKLLAETGANENLQINWLNENIQILNDSLAADLVTMSYALGEIPQENHTSLLRKLLTAAQQFVVLIEPGTPRGFQTLQNARELLIKEGGTTIAPCTHDKICPLIKNDWCHFSQRIQRSALHRQIKDAHLVYEDEKYSYLIIAKQPVMREKAGRIVKMPLQRSGHVRLDICDEEGLHKVTISKKAKDLYHSAKKAEWGHKWNQQITKEDD